MNSRRRYWRRVKITGIISNVVMGSLFVICGIVLILLLFALFMGFYNHGIDFFYM